MNGGRFLIRSTRFRGFHSSRDTHIHTPQMCARLQTNVYRKLGCLHMNFNLNFDGDYAWSSDVSGLSLRSKQGACGLFMQITGFLLRADLGNYLYFQISPRSAGTGNSYLRGFTFEIRLWNLNFVCGLPTDARCLATAGTIRNARMGCGSTEEMPFLVRTHW